MHYSIILLAAMLIAASFTGFGFYRNVIVSFKDGMYDPATVHAVGGVAIIPLEKLGMVRASIPELSLAFLNMDPAVKTVEFDAPSQIQLDNTNIANASSTEYNTNWGIGHIGVEQAHTEGITGKGIKIAELDTGIDYHHPDLVRAYKGGYDFINNSPNPMDDNGHGTHVAGIIAAAGIDAGEVGVAPDAQLYAVKVSDSQGKGSFGLLVQGIDWAIENHMNVITMSITGEGGSPALQQAISDAHDKYGITIVAAAGNGDGGGILFPAAYSDVIAVGATDQHDQRASFSLTGPQLELVAPGSMINSTWPGGHYKVLSGTSMATPFVTGTVALILGSNEKAWAPSKLTKGNGTWTTDEVRRVLDSMTNHLGAPGKNDQYGYGELMIKFPAQTGTAESGSPSAPLTITSSLGFATLSSFESKWFSLFASSFFVKLGWLDQPN